MDCDEELPIHLYKYYPPERISFFQDELVRFSQPSALNDPFEFSFGAKEFIGDPARDFLIKEISETIKDREKFTNFLTKSERFKFAWSPSIFDEIYERAISNANWLLNNAEFGIESIRKYGFPFEDFSEFHEKYGVFSLSSEIKNPILWSLYANRYTGFLLVLDAFHEWFTYKGEGKKSNLWKVKYTDDVDQDLIGLKDRNINFLARKHTAWAHEREWRIVRDLSEADRTVSGHSEEKICLFRVPSDVVLGVVLGPFCDIKLRDAVITYKVQKNPGLQIGKLEINQFSSEADIQVYDI